MIENIFFIIAIYKYTFIILLFNVPPMNIRGDPGITGGRLLLTVTNLLYYP
jgi:hypothetical protein